MLIQKYTKSKMKVTRGPPARNNQSLSWVLYSLKFPLSRKTIVLNVINLGKAFFTSVEKWKYVYENAHYVILQPQQRHIHILRAVSKPVFLAEPIIFTQLEISFKDTDSQRRSHSNGLKYYPLAICYFFSLQPLLPWGGTEILYTCFQTILLSL